MTAAWRAAVEVAVRARRAWPFLPVRAPIGSVWVSGVGETVRVLADGTAAPVVPFGAKSIAADPCAGVAARP